MKSYNYFNAELKIQGYCMLQNPIGRYRRLYMNKFFTFVFLSGRPMLKMYIVWDETMDSMPDWPRLYWQSDVQYRVRKKKPSRNFIRMQRTINSGEAGGRIHY